MTPAEMPACTNCGGHYASALAAAECCNPQYDETPTYKRSYELGYD